jgi:hypothetical protein
VEKGWKYSPYKLLDQKVIIMPSVSAYNKGVIV